MTPKTALGKLILINLLLTFAGVEALSLAAYAVRSDQLFYLDGERHPSMTFGLHQDAHQNVEAKPSGQQDIVQRLQPFFGYVLRPGAYAQVQDLGVRVNNYGFFAQADYPYRPENPDSRFVIGVFGGSVASDLATFGVLSHARGQEGLVSALRRIDALADKEIVILNFANGGYKQPQQLLILSYFLSLGQPLDLVLNIDGFNEVALSNLNPDYGYNVAMPSGEHMAPMVGLAAGDTVLELAAVRLRLARERLNDRIKAMNRSWLASAYTVREVLLRLPAARFDAAVGAYQEALRGAPARDKSAALFHFPPPDGPGEQTVKLGVVRDQWVRSSLLMRQMAEDAGALHLHVLQPNQYFDTERVFTAVELRDFVSPQQRYAQGVQLGYPLLVAAASTLEQQGVHFLDATRVFDDEPATVYRDDCCHYNDLGQMLLAEFIARTVEEQLAGQTAGGVGVEAL